MSAPGAGPHDVPPQGFQQQFELGDMRRLAGVGELAAALAEDDPTHKPLATALEESVRAAQSFDLDQSGTSLRLAQDICGG